MYILYFDDWNWSFWWRIFIGTLISQMHSGEILPWKVSEIWIDFFHYHLTATGERMNPFFHCLLLLSHWRFVNSETIGGSRIQISLRRTEMGMKQPKYLNFSLAKIWTQYRWGNHQIQGKYLSHCTIEAHLVAFCYFRIFSVIHIKNG